MQHGEKQGNALILNESNHNEKGNPHPQSFELPIYRTGFKSGSTKQYIKIFDEDFQQLSVKEKLIDYNRGFNSIFAKLHIYDLFSDNIYASFNLSFYLYLTNAGTLHKEVYIGKEFGKFDMDCKIYVKSTTKIAPDSTSYNDFNVKVYLSSTNAGGRYRIRPQIYHSPESHIQNPLKIKANSQGFNSYQQLNDLFKNLESETFVDEATLTSTLSGYTVTTYSSNTITNRGTRALTGNDTTAIATTIAFTTPHSQTPIVNVNVTDNNANYLVQIYNVTVNSFSVAIRKNSSGTFNGVIASNETINLVWKSTE